MTDYQLWGFDGELGGNEDRWMGRLPILRQGDRFFVARSLDWSPQSPRTLTLLSSEEAALDAGTALSLNERVPAEPGRFVALIGPEYRDALERSGMGNATFLTSFRPIQERFLFAYQAEEEFEVSAQRVADEAKKRFDNELRNVECSMVTDAAAASLDVLRGNTFGHDEQVLIRALAAAELASDPDRFRTQLEVTAVRLGRNSETLRGWLSDYWRLLKPAAKAVLAQRSSSALLANSQSRSAMLMIEAWNAQKHSNQARNVAYAT